MIVYSWFSESGVVSAVFNPPVIVMVCAASQLLRVKVKLAGVTVPSVASELDSGTETLDLGFLVSLTPT